MAKKKENKKIKVRDLKSKKDAKGGMAPNVSNSTSTNVGVSGRGVQGSHRITC